VSEQEELDRVLPVVEALADCVPAVLSVDTSTPVVMREAARAGAGMLNDVRALARGGARRCRRDRIARMPDAHAG
jgi:dihydropteroate synthase